MTVQLPEKQKELFGTRKADFVVAAGLALSDKRKFNLLPTQIKVLYRLSTLRTGIAVGLLLFAVTLVFLYFVTRGKVKGYQGLLRRNESYVARFESNVTVMNELKKWEEMVKKREKTISEIEREPLWHGVLKEISNIIPEGVLLESIRLFTSPDDEMGLNIKGNLTSEGSGFSKFLIDLNGSPFFEDVVLVSRKKEKSGEIGFELKCDLVY